MKLNFIKNSLILKCLVTISVISVILGNTIFDLITVFLIFIVCIIIGSRERVFLNPYNFFSLAPFSLLIYYNVSNTYMMDLKHETYVLAIINMVAFILALSITPSVKIKFRENCEDTDSTLFLKINAIILFLISLLGPVFPALQSVMWLFSIAAMVCAFKTKKVSMVSFVIIYFFIIAFGGTSKMSILVFVLVFLISMEKYYIISKRQIRIMKLLSVFGIIFLIYAFSFANKERGNYDADYGLWYYTNQGVEWRWNSSLFLPYMYLTTPWANLQYVTESQNIRTNGMWTIKPVISYLQLDDEFKHDYELIPYSSFNTFTFITVGFKDFGFWMSIIPTLILGFIVKKVYSRYFLFSNPFDVATYVIVSLATTEMFFSNHFYMFSYPFSMIIIMWAYKFLVCRKSKQTDKVFCNQ